MMREDSLGDSPEDSEEDPEDGGRDHEAEPETETEAQWTGEMFALECFAEGTDQEIAA